jgi:hypothetical protein
MDRSLGFQPLVRNGTARVHHNGRRVLHLKEDSPPRLERKVPCKYGLVILINTCKPRG